MTKFLSWFKQLNIINKSLTPGIAQSPVSFLFIAMNWSTGLPSISRTCPSSSRSHLLIIGSAAWFGPYLPKSPRPLSPVRPNGFLYYFTIIEFRIFIAGFKNGLCVKILKFLYTLLIICLKKRYTLFSGNKETKNKIKIIQTYKLQL